MIEKKQIQEKLKETLDKKRDKKFLQSIDLSIGLKQLNLKNSSETVDEFIFLPNNTGSKVKICGLIDKELQTQSKKAFDKTILVNEFSKYSNKKDLKKLAGEYDFFVAQVNVMADVAKNFGRVFGPRNKMPNPKASCVVGPNADLTQLAKRLQQTVRLKAKKSPVINVKVGNEKQKIEEIVENVYEVIDFVIKHLPLKEQNIKHVYLKTTMGESVKLM